MVASTPFTCKQEAQKAKKKIPVYKLIAIYGLKAVTHRNWLHTIRRLALLRFPQTQKQSKLAT